MTADEGSKNVSPQSQAQAEKVEPKAEGKVVPEHQYIGVKEMLRKREEELAEKDKKLLEYQTQAEQQAAKLKAEVEEKTSQLNELVEKVKNLEEQLKTRVDKGEYEKAVKAMEAKAAEVLEAKKEAICAKWGVDKELLKDLGEKDLSAFEKGLAAKGKTTSKPDISGIGSRGELKGTPRELAVQAYETGKK